MRKVYKKLLNEQKNRGVVFSSELLGGGDSVRHEVLNTLSQEEQSHKIELLLDDSFFNNSIYKVNEIRQ